MKSLLLSSLIILSAVINYAQPGSDILRSLAEEDLYPFYHGVASGDPTTSNVIIWTRVTPDVDGPVVVDWKVSTDTTFSDTIQLGNFTTDMSRDYTVKVDVGGLSPNTWYYYEFTALGKNSVIGRTKTAPAGSVDHLRFGVVSCSSYETGYFNAYEKIFERNDVDAVIHLGDYYYEYGSNSSLAGPRSHIPDHEIVVLADYRMRHAQHKLDEDSRVMHQNFPLIAVWDDHETANNSWRDGADNHSPGSEGPWVDRKAASLQAYYEWMPIRVTDEMDPQRIWRKFNYGSLADIYMLDTRIYDRDEQTDYEGHGDPERTMIGPDQMEWLQESMLASTAKWQVVGQQVMMGPLVIPNPLTQEILITLNNDQWDGYRPERERLFDFLVDNDIDNMVVLTGDIHTQWAMDLPYDIFNYNPSTGEGSVAVEFVGTSVTSTSSPIGLPPVTDLIMSVAPYIKYVDLSRKGYTILDLTNDQAQGDAYTVHTIKFPSAMDFFQEGWYTEDGENRLQKADGPSVDSRPQHPTAPADPREIETSDSTVTAIYDPVQLDILGVYPNPFGEVLVLELHLFEEHEVSVSIFDTKASEVYSQEIGLLPRGRNMVRLEDLQLPGGIYELVIADGNRTIRRSIVSAQ